MKPVHVVLAHVVTLAVGLFVYDQIRADQPARNTARADGGRSGAASVDALKRRLDALEARPISSPSRLVGRNVLDRLAALERALSVSAATADASSPEPRADRGEPAANSTPTEADILRFRKLREAVRRQDVIKKNAQSVDAALDKLSVRLTQDQRRQVHVAFAAFRPRVSEIWAEAKTEARTAAARGEDVDVKQFVASTTARIQSEFAQSLAGVVRHPADAQAVAAGLLRGK